MIKRFSDLAANERTYLAWVRTSIAMMTFGFLIEKFELFLRMITAAQTHILTQKSTSEAIEAVGIVMMAVSVVMMITATSRYFLQRRQILSEQEIEIKWDTVGLMLSIFLVLISVFLIGYIWLRLSY